MANASITINQFNDVLKRLEKLEQGHKEVPVTIEKDIEELKEGYHKIDKEQATFGEKLDSFRREFRTEIKSLEKRFTMMWGLQVATFLAILVLILKDIIFP
ncbi:hypothetical protein BEH94_02270 [Candidatus Altiarchaeales archaeon WOR_SM1_SCG]|nr:hypothetical protein BEH94_02270 [Candidatus Altiarchaeales archaeon WOR_SM1_SCG]